MPLLTMGDFVLHSGSRSRFKIDCDALTDADLEAAAAWLSQALLPFGTVEGVPRGGLRLAEALRKYAMPGDQGLLLVDDVLTSGASLEKQRAGRKAVGAVLFSRTLIYPSWVTALFIVGVPA